MEKNLLNELNDNEIDTLMKYTIPFSEENNRNIKNKFLQKATKKQKRLSLKKLIIPAVAASLLIASTLVYAQVLDFSRIYKIVFGEKSEYVEQYIEPLDSGNTAQAVIESEYDGIVLKLISVINDGDALRIFATMEDTTGNRLSDSIDFNDWGLSQGHGGNVTVVDYNREAKTATLLITSLGGYQEGNATLSINSFTTSRELTEGLKETKINVYEILQKHTPQAISQSIDRREIWKVGGGSQSDKGLVLYETSDILKPDETDIKFENIDWAHISNLGFVDGYLHIQTAKLIDNESHLMNISFVNEKNDIVYNEHSRIDFIEYENRYGYDGRKPFDVYQDMIYENITDVEQLRELNMVIDVWEQGNVIKGKWAFSFEIPKKVTTEFKVDRELNINGELVKIEAVSLSPLGIILNMPGNIANNYKHEDFAYVTYNDGTIVELNDTLISGHQNSSTLKFGGNIIEIEKVKSIVINDKIISIK